MSLAGTYALTVQALGITVVGTADRTGTIGIDAVDTTLPVGHAGVLTTRTSATAGVVTLTAGHDIVTGVVDIHWPGGCRYNMGGTVSDTNTLTLVIGDSAGDDLPAQTTAIVAAPPVSLDVTFDADNLTLIGAGASRQTSLRFMVSTSVELASLIVAGASWGWAEDMAVTNPLAGHTITTIEVSCGDATYTSNFKLTGLQY
jgi:hypothetical protein